MPTLDEIDAELARRQKIQFKNDSVAKEYERVNPKIKEALAGMPGSVVITSGSRTPEENAAVGGVNGSYHTKDLALDFRDLSPEQRAFFKDLKATIVDERDHVHTQFPNYQNDNAPVANNGPSLEEIDAELKRRGALKSSTGEVAKGALKKGLEDVVSYTSGFKPPFTDLALKAAEKITGKESPIKEYNKPSSLAGILGKMQASGVEGAATAPALVESFASKMPSFIGSKLAPLLSEMLGSAASGQLTRGAEINPAATAMDVAIPPVVRGVGNLAGMAGRAIRGSEVPEKLMAMGTGIKYGDNPEVIDYLLKNKIIGSKEELANLSEAQKRLIGNKLNKLLKGKEINLSEIPTEANYVPTPEESGDVAAGGIESSKRAYKKVFNELKGLFKPNEAGEMTAPLDLMNEQKSGLAKAGKKAFGDSQGVSSIKLAQKKMSDVLRDIARGKMPDEATVQQLDALNSEYNIYRTMKDEIDDAIVKGRNAGLNTEISTKRIADVLTGPDKLKQNLASILFNNRTPTADLLNNVSNMSQRAGYGAPAISSLLGIDQR